MIHTCPRCGQNFEINDTMQDVSDIADGCRDTDCPMQAYRSSRENPWGDLRAYWEESYARECANPPSDKPTRATILSAGHRTGDMPAPINTWVWVTEIDTTGVGLAKLDDEGRWWLAEAGDLWPCHPTHWLPRVALTGKELNAWRKRLGLTW